MAKQLYSIDCAPECGFKVRSHDEEEAVSFATTHVDNVHDGKYSEEEVRKMVKTS